MSKSRKRLLSALAAAGLTFAAAGVSAGTAASHAAATGPNRRPICNSLLANVPPLGQSVIIPVTNVAADPDLTPVSLVSVFGGAPLGTVSISNNGTPQIPNDDVLVFTRTTDAEVMITLYWTVSDGSLTAQCQSSIDNSAPVENG